MIVRNWMSSNPTTIEGGMMLVEAYQLFSDQSVRAMPVMEDGTLRGLLTRAHCLRAVENIARTQDNHEFDYFTNKLKVRDIMVRSPATIEATDTMEYCMRVGQEDGNSQFPVLDNGKVVGIVTATEIFSMAAQLIGAWDHSSGVTLQGVTDSHLDMNRIAAVVDEIGARLQSIYPLRMESKKHRRIVVRFETDNLDAMVKIFENEGFAVLEKKFRRKPVVKSNDS